MNRTAAPASAKAFALVSVLVTALALVVSLGVVFLQNLLKGAFSSDPGILAIFSFPALSFLVRFLPVLLVAYSVVRSMLNWGYGLLRYSAVAAFVSISVLTYQAAVDARAQMPQYTGGNT